MGGSQRRAGCRPATAEAAARARLLASRSRSRGGFRGETAWGGGGKKEGALVEMVRWNAGATHHVLLHPCAAARAACAAAAGGGEAHHGGQHLVVQAVMGREAHGEVGRLACVHPLGDHLVLLLLKVLVLLVVPILLEGKLEDGRRTCGACR